MKLSIIIPCKNEEGNLLKLNEKIKETLKDIKYEAIFIDDGSTDKTIDELHELYEKDMQHVKVISFSRNFKKEAAMLAGLEHAKGEYTCIIDADLQQNPKYLLEMYDYLEENKDYDVVGMVMKERTTESGFMKFCKNMFYKKMNDLCDLNIENAASDFRMFRTNVREAMISLGEKNRFTKGIFAWIGFKTKFLPYEVEPRNNGKSSFGFVSSLKYAMTGIMAFSYKPLKLAIKLGILALLAALIYLIVVLVQVLALGYEMNAVYALIILVLFLFGIQFILLGVIGTYLGLINDEAKNRPVYLVKEKLGFSGETIL